MRQRDLVERRRGLGQNRSARLVGTLPDHLRHRAERQLRHLHRQRDRRRLGKHLRLRVQRLGHLHRRVPGMQRAGHGSGDGKQRARLLGLELGRQAGDRKLAVPPQLGRGRAELGKPRRRTAAAGRRMRPAQHRKPEPAHRSSRRPKSRGARSFATTSSPKTTTSRFRPTPPPRPRRGERASSFRATTPIWSNRT